MDDILDILVAHGVPGAVVVRVAELIADAKQIEKRRANNRERMQAVRTRAHTRKHTETPPPASLLLTTPPIQNPKQGSVRGTRLPAEWKPDAEDCEYAGSFGLSWKALFTDFSDYWHARAGPGAVKMDWKATWRRWCRTTSERKNANGGQNGNGRRHGSVLDAFDRLGEKLKAAGATDDYVPGSEGPRPLELDQKMRPDGLKLVPKG